MDTLCTTDCGAVYTNAILAARLGCAEGSSPNPTPAGGGGGAAVNTANGPVSNTARAPEKGKAAGAGDKAVCDFYFSWCVRAAVSVWVLGHRVSSAKQSIQSIQSAHPAFTPITHSLMHAAPPTVTQLLRVVPGGVRRGPADLHRRGGGQVPGLSQVPHGQALHRVAETPRRVRTKEGEGWPQRKREGGAWVGWLVGSRCTMDEGRRRELDVCVERAAPHEHLQKKHTRSEKNTCPI